MQIDWITVIAQLINFLVLIWLLKRFLYGPITNAIVRREARIAERLRDSEDARREAKRQAEALAEQRAAVDRQQGEIMEEARHQAKTLRETLEREARDEAQELRHAWRQQVDDEKEAFLGSVRQSTARYVGELARTVLKELADADLEAQAAKRFADHLRALDGKSGRISRRPPNVSKPRSSSRARSSFRGPSRCSSRGRCMRSSPRIWTSVTGR